MREDLLRVILGGVAGLALVLLGALADLVGLALGEADDLLLAGDGEGLLLGVGDDRVGLGRGAREQLVALLQDAAGLLPLLGIAHADLVEDVQDRLGLDHLELGFAEGRLGFLDDSPQLIDKAFDPLAGKVVASHQVSFRRLCSRANSITGPSAPDFAGAAVCIL